MNFSRPFILRPVATTLLTVALVISGLLAWRMLPVAALPSFEYPVIQVLTFRPGAGADVVARTVTAPLERRLGQIPGLRQMSSSSSGGASAITLQFLLDVDIGVAEQEVQAAINAASSLLPDDLPTPPVYRKVNPADAPILTLAVSSDTLPLPVLYDLVDTRVAQKIAQVSGVGMVSLMGGQRPAVRIQANPRALAAHGLTLEALREAIAQANASQPTGSLDGPYRFVMIEANDQIRSVEAYRQVVVAWRNGAPLRLGDVATVEQGPEDRFLAAWSGHCGAQSADDCASGGARQMPAVLVSIQRQPGANVIEVADQVRALLPQLTATLPTAADVVVLNDRTRSIRASVRGVQQELLFAIALVVLVTFIFLRRVAATLIPSVAVPLSLVGTFGAMYLAGFSLNNLSLMALTIATGFVVDDAIVMLENIARHREAGETPLAAALKGASEIGFTLLSLTLSLIAVLIPLLFMGDVVGRLFREFAITLAVAILISLLISLTLTPMMAARMLGDRQRGAPVEAVRPGVFDRVLAVYARWLDRVLAHQTLTLMVLVATLALTAGLYLSVPKGFFPVQDSGVIQVITEAPPTVSFAAMAERQQALAEVALADPDVIGLSSFIGVDGNTTTLNSGRMLLELKPHRERRADAAEIGRRLSVSMVSVPGIVAWLQPAQELSVEDRIARTQYQLTLATPDHDQLEDWVGRVLDALRIRPELADVASDLQRGGREVFVDIDRDAAARLGVSASAIVEALHSGYGQRQVATLFTQASQYRVVLEVAPSLATGPAALGALHVPAADATPVPLSSLARFSERTTALAIHHQGQFPAATISFNLAPGVSLGAAVEAIESTVAAIGLPPSVEMRFQGAAEAFRASLGNTLWLILAAVVTMYIVLGVLYESTVHPLTILSTLPSATVGALAALHITGRPLDLIAVIGIVLLIGLVKKNGIMMVDFALDAQRRLGLASHDAIRRAALLRFRPILMTTLAALVGALPLMLAGGSGAELRQPLGIVMVGGLLVSQVLTVFTTPVVYLFFDRLTRRTVASGVPPQIVEKA
ncbi:MAG: efflux RND transporter permease subunit [Rhodocyclaceae bacterium]